MTTKFNNAVRALNTAELALTGACRRINKYLRPNTTTSRAASPVSVSGTLEGRQPIIGETSPTDGVGAIIRRQFSGPREPPAIRPRRRMLSTNCSDCKHREHEIGMTDADAQVGKCPHGIEDRIREIEDPVFAGPEDQRRSPVETRRPDNEQERLIGRRINRQRQPTVEEIEEDITHMERCHVVVIEKQQIVIELSVFQSEEEQAERMSAITERLNGWDDMVQNLKYEAKSLLRLLREGLRPTVTFEAQKRQIVEQFPAEHQPLLYQI